MGGGKGFRDAEVVRLYADGISVADIVERMDVSYDTVLRVLKKEGVYKITPLVNAVKEQLVRHEMATDKTSYLYAGKRFDSLRDLKVYRKELSVTVNALFKEGVSKVDIAQRCGLSVKSVGMFLKG
mgnify:CR=1 FL=1